MDLGGQSKETSWIQFKNEMLLPRDVDRIEVINKERVNVYIRKDKLNQDKYKDVSKKALGDAPNAGPHFFFTIGDVGSFDKQIDEAQQGFAENEKIAIKYNNNERSLFDFFLTWLFPIILLVLLWMFLFRRMGGG